MKKLFLLLLPISLVGQTGGLSIVNGVIDQSAAGHTVTIKVVANVPALPSTGCKAGELAIVSSATPGQQMYQNSTTGSCTWTQQLNTGSSSGGGITVYSAPSLSLTGTQYIPIGGGGFPSATELNVDVPSPSAATITNLAAEMSAAPGVGNSVAVTWRKNAVSQSVTCTISGGSATSCSDTTHSFTVSQGDLLSIQLVTTGVIAGTPSLVTAVQFGTTGSNGTVNNGTLGQVAYYAAGGTAVSGLGPGTTTTLLHGNAAGAGSFGAVVEADQTLANNTTNNVSTSKHGYTPILPNDATKFLDGTGAYSVPPGSGGGFVLVEEHTAAASSELDFTTCFTSTYDEYEINAVSLLPATNTVSLLMQVSTDGGATYDTGNNYDWSKTFTGVSTSDSGSYSATTSTSSMLWWDTDLGNTSGAGLSGKARLFNPLNASGSKPMIYETIALTASGNWYYVKWAGRYRPNTAVNAFRFKAGSGNLASGTVRCYGLAK